MMSRDIAELQEKLGHPFSRPELLERALTHTSHAHEREAAQPSVPREGVGDNEQLEFLGDAVLGLVTAEQLFQRLPSFREGKLSKLRSHLVSERHLARVAQNLNLGEYLRLGRGEEKSGGRNKAALLADAMEAVLAAVYLDGGLEAVRGVIGRWIVGPEIEDLIKNDNGMPVRDHKSALQEQMQAAGHAQPVYTLVAARGPEHSKTFTVEVRVQIHPRGGRPFTSRAEGSTKKNAEQEAARSALDYLASRLDDPRPRSPRKGKS
jgi:ribonuclease-3